MDIQTALAAKASGQVLSGPQLEALLKRPPSNGEDDRRADTTPRRQRQVGLG